MGWIFNRNSMGDMGIQGNGDMEGGCCINHRSELEEVGEVSSNRVQEGRFRPRVSAEHRGARRDDGEQESVDLPTEEVRITDEITASIRSLSQPKLDALDSVSNPDAPDPECQ